MDKSRIKIGLSLIAILFASLIFSIESSPEFVYSIYSLYRIEILTISVILSTGAVLIVSDYFNDLNGAILFIMWLFTSTLFSLPLLANMKFYGRTGDALYHIGHLRTISISGVLPSNIQYPNSHLLSYSVSSILDVSITHVVMFTPQIYFTILVLSSILLCRYVDKVGKNILILSPFLFIFSGNPTFHPYTFSIFLLPIFVFTIIYSNIDVRSAYLAVLFIFALALTHPITGVIAAVSLVFISVISYISHGGPDLKQIRLEKTKQIYALALFALLITYSWIFYQSPFFFRLITIRLIGFISDPVGFLFTASELSGKAETAQQGAAAGYNIYRIALQWYGPILVGWILTVISSFIIVYTKIREEKKFGKDSIIILSFIFSGVVLSIVHPLTGFINVNPARPLPLVVVFFGWSFGKMVANIDFGLKSNHKKVIVLVIFALLFSVTMTNVFPDPINKKPNIQTTETDFKGSEWLIENKNTTPKIYNFRTYQHRFSSYHIGSEATKSRSDISRPGVANIRLDEHLTKYNGFNLSIDSESYVMISNFDILYANKYRDQSGFAGKIRLMKDDDTLNYIYSNGRFWTYKKIYY